MDWMNMTMSEKPLNLKPTRTCFEDAAGFSFLSYVATRAQAGYDTHKNIHIAHGVLVAIGDRLIAHAWLEDSIGDGLVVDCKMLDGERVTILRDRAEYYKTNKVQDSSAEYQAGLPDSSTHVLRLRKGPYDNQYYNINGKPFNG